MICECSFGVWCLLRGVCRSLLFGCCVLSDSCGLCVVCVVCLLFVEY